MLTGRQARYTLVPGATWIRYRLQHRQHAPQCPLIAESIHAQPCSSARSISITPGRSSMLGRGVVTRLNDDLAIATGEDPAVSAGPSSPARPTTPIGMNSEGPIADGDAPGCKRTTGDPRPQQPKTALERPSAS